MFPEIIIYRGSSFKSRKVSVRRLTTRDPGLNRPPTAPHTGDYVSGTWTRVPVTSVHEGLRTQLFSSRPWRVGEWEGDGDKSPTQTIKVPSRSGLMKRRGPGVPRNTLLLLSTNPKGGFPRRVEIRGIDPGVSVVYGVEEGDVRMGIVSPDQS